jgi:hypothetical protein
MFLDTEPSPRTDRRCHALQGHCRLGHMHQQRPTVDEIILRRLQVLGEDMMLAYLDVGREGRSAQQVWIEIRCNHLT